MTGPTEFTRKAGAAGLVFCVLDAVYLLTGHEYADAQELSDDVQALVFAAAVAGLVSFVGMVKRHRGQRWRRTAGMLALVGLVLMFTGIPSLGVYVVLAALLIVQLGFAFGGILPLAAGLLVLATVPLTYVSVVLATVAGLAGLAWQSWALWREPLPDAARATAPA